MNSTSYRLFKVQENHDSQKHEVLLNLKTESSHFKPPNAPTQSWHS